MSLFKNSVSIFIIKIANNVTFYEKVMFVTKKKNDRNFKRTIEKMLFNKDENPQQINTFYLQPLVLFLGDEVSGFNFLNKIFSGKHCKLPSYMRNEDF